MSRFRLFALTTPCTSCPFRAVPPPNGTPLFRGLRRERVAGIAQSLREGGTFPCHKTVDYSDDAGEGVTDDSSLCAGALATMAREGDTGPLFASATVQIGERLGLFDPDNLDLGDVYGSLGEWQVAMRERES